MPQRLIRDLDPVQDRAAVAAFLDEAQDYYHLWLHRGPGAAELDDIFTSVPPGCDPARTWRPGLYLDGRLSGVAELSFGYPTAEDAFLGLMILAPHARGAGHGEWFHTQVLDRARAAGCPRIYLGVLDQNPRGWAFWRRMGYVETGITRFDAETQHLLHRLVRPNLDP